MLFSVRCVYGSRNERCQQTGLKLKIGSGQDICQQSRKKKFSVGCMPCQVAEAEGEDESKRTLLSGAAAQRIEIQI